MQDAFQIAIASLLAFFALPAVGLGAIFIISTLAATLIPLGSEPVLFAYVRHSPEMYWPAIAAATAGNVLGGVISFGMGWGARRTFEAWRDQPQGEAPAPRPESGRWHERAQAALQRFGPPAMLLAWLPGIGDPLCAVAGWLRLPFWPSLLFMAIGKFLRYLFITGALLWLWPGDVAS